MSGYDAQMKAIRRERETEAKVRSMEAHEIVELIHRLEDEIKGLEAGLAEISPATQGADQ